MVQTLFPFPPPTHCSLNSEDCDPDCFTGMIQEASNERELIEAYTGLLQKRVELEQFDAAKQDLENEQRDVALKILIATYTKESNIDSAWVRLNELPLDSDENIAFYNLYAEILEGIEPPAGSGKTMSKQEQLIRTTATNANKAVAVQAEVVMNGFYGHLFSKNLEITNVHEFSFDIDKFPLLIYPNPAQNEIIIQYWGKSKKKITLEVVDIYGKLLNNAVIPHQNPLSLSIRDLPTGIYYCVVRESNYIVTVQKLVVIK